MKQAKRHREYCSGVMDRVAKANLPGRVTSNRELLGLSCGLEAWSVGC